MKQFILYLDGFTCNIPVQQTDFMKDFTKNPNCKPTIECEILDPYNEDSVLAESECVKVNFFILSRNNFYFFFFY